jgi:arylsulfatase K
LSDRPNILLIHSDSMDGRAMGCMGHAAAHTPNMDALARRGTLHRQACCPSPVCVPSRVATWTGRHSHRHQVWNNACGRPDDSDTFLPLLQQAGYDTHSIGRDDRYQGGHSFGLLLRAWTRASGVTTPPRDHAPRVQTVTDRDRRVRLPDWQCTDSAIAWLSDRAAASTTRPFFLSVGWSAPHPGGGYNTSPYYLDKVPRSRIALPPRDTHEHPAMRHMRLHKGYPHAMTDEQIIDLRHHYLGMVAEVDEQLGAVMQHVEATGLASSTVLIYFSDHGDMQMEHGQWRKSSMYESSVRVPLIVAGPGFDAGREVAEPCSLLDLFPTLLAIAGVEQASQRDGVSLCHPSDALSQRPRPVFAQYHESLQPTGSFMIRQERWKYVHYVGHEPQLFDLEADPDELDNRAVAQPDVAAALESRLRQSFDFEAIDAQAKAYDRRCFAKWRALVGEAEYRRAMAEHCPRWGEAELAQIDRWLAQESAAPAADDQAELNALAQPANHRGDS